MKDRSAFHNKFHYWLLFIIAFSIPLCNPGLTNPLLPALIGVLTLNWLVSGQIKNLFSLGQKKWYVLLFTGFYFIHLLAMTYSDNIEFGLNDLEIKLSLLLFPVLFATSSLLSGSQKLKISLGFVLGCLSGVLVSFINGFYHFYLSKDISSIYYSQLSLFHHPGYYSMYLCLCIVIGAYYLIYKKAITNRFQRIVFSSIIPLFSIFITLLMSKIGIICLGFVLVSGLYVLMAVEKKIKTGIVLSIAGGLLFYGLNNMAPRPFSRFETAATVYMEKSENLETNSAESTTARLLVWPIAFQIGLENPLLGVGTGDIKDELIKRYVDKDLKGVLGRRFNVHNQFLQAFATLGLLGSLVFLLGFCVPFYRSFLDGNWVYVGFIAIVVLNCAIESILEVQAGVVFYAFFNAFFAFNTLGKK